MYSPITPSDSSCTPPRNVIGSTVDAQPGAKSSNTSRSTRKYSPSRKLPNAIVTPDAVITRSGYTLNDVMPLIASEIIRRIEYFVSPADRSNCSYCTVVERKPSRGMMPRMNRLTSPYSSSASTARRPISR